MPSLVGNKPNQVPTNGDLGTLAFEDADNVIVGNITSTGVNTVAAGTVSAPAITTSGDTNTGIFFPAADTIAFTEGGVEALRIDSSANVGIGTSSPSAKLDVVGTSGTEQFRIGNASGGTDFGITVTENSSTIINSAEGATGRGIQFQSGGTNTVFIDSAGYVGIGTSSPVGILDAVTAGAGLIRMRSSTGSGTVGFQAQNSDTGTTATDGLFVGIDGSEQGYVYNYENTPIIFGTNNAERMRIDSSGNVLIGTTSVGSATSGSTIRWGKDGNASMVATYQAAVANNGTVDINLGGGGAGTMCILEASNSNSSNATIATRTIYAVMGRGTTFTFTSIGTQNGTSGGFGFSMSCPSNGTLRLTNTSGSNGDVVLTAYGTQAY